MGILRQFCFSSFTQALVIFAGLWFPASFNHSCCQAQTATNPQISRENLIRIGILTSRERANGWDLFLLRRARLCGHLLLQFTGVQRCICAVRCQDTCACRGLCGRFAWAGYCHSEIGRTAQRGYAFLNAPWRCAPTMPHNRPINCSHGARLSRVHCSNCRK